MRVAVVLTTASWGLGSHRLRPGPAAKLIGVADRLRATPRRSRLAAHARRRLPRPCRRARRLRVLPDRRPARPPGADHVARPAGGLAARPRPGRDPLPGPRAHAA